ncbi:hydrogenase nickel incorporation protein HypB [candidate division WOR-3 bacterium]|nr:hydrogenase nickel incorporation protein HypB [candidate division WOR-3 bacterium]
MHKIDMRDEESLLAHNRELAEEINKKLKERGIRSIDVMGAIGSGKTTILEKLSERLKGSYRIGALAGDLTTTIDADRIARHGAKTFQISTGKECHLDAHFISHAVDEVADEIDLLFIENVGNLICPADFPLGADQRMVVISVTEGPYMVKKHPYIFAEADVAVINKRDLAEAMEVSVEDLEADIKEISPDTRVVRMCARAGEGIDELIKALGL